MVLKIIIPKQAPLLDNVHYVRYADMKMEYEFAENNKKVTEEQIEDKIIYTLEIDNPNLFYTYSLEWDFINVKS